MKHIRTKVWDDRRKRLAALSIALAEFRDSLTLLSLSLRDYQFEKEMSLRDEAEYTTNSLLAGLIISGGADRSGSPDAPHPDQR